LLGSAVSLRCIFHFVFQLKAPDAKLMPIREEVEELFAIEELQVDIRIFILCYMLFNFILQQC